jgi:hypothetical protein
MYNHIKDKSIKLRSVFQETTLQLKDENLKEKYFSYKGFL